jgi:Flp pilus assembly protein TadD
MALAEGRGGDALPLLERYLLEAGPDPETLATLAVVQANLGRTEAAARTIGEARELLPEGWRRAELEASIYARAGDAAAAVGALRLLQAQGRLDREALRADPAFVPIATDPVWVAFLAEPGP